MKEYAFIKWVVRLFDTRYICDCWVAFVKRSLGFAVRRAPNRLPGVQNPCPAWAYPLIAMGLLLYQIRGRR